MAEQRTRQEQLAVVRAAAATEEGRAILDVLVSPRTLAVLLNEPESTTPGNADRLTQHHEVGCTRKPHTGLCFPEEDATSFDYSDDGPENAELYVEVEGGERVVLPPGMTEADLLRSMLRQVLPPESAEPTLASDVEWRAGIDGTPIPPQPAEKVSGMDDGDGPMRDVQQRTEAEQAFYDARLTDPVDPPRPPHHHPWSGT